MDDRGVLLRCPAVHKAWKTGCRAEQRQLEEADRLVPLLGALAIVTVRLLSLRDAARRHGAAPAAVPQTTIQILAAKLHQPAACFTTNRDFLRGVARLGGFLARKSDGEPGWLTIWKGWFVLSTGATHEAIKFLFVGTALTSGKDFLLGRPRFRPWLNLSGIPKNRTQTLHALPLG